jgi:hypothetical protein
VQESASTEPVAYTAGDWLSGFFVAGGKQYRHSTDLIVSRTEDGLRWQPAGKLTLPGRPGSLWAFAADERRIGIGLLFNNLYTKWFKVSAAENLAELDLELPFMQQSGEAECFVRDGELTCARPLLDPERHKPMLVVTATRRAWGGSTP